MWFSKNPPQKEKKMEMVSVVYMYLRCLNYSSLTLCLLTIVPGAPCKQKQNTFI